MLPTPAILYRYACLYMTMRAGGRMCGSGGAASLALAADVWDVWTLRNPVHSHPAPALSLKQTSPVAVCYSSTFSDGGEHSVFIS